MDKKTLSIISYITIIGWIVSFIIYNNEPIKSPLVRFHLQQALGLAVVQILAGIVFWLLVMIMPFIVIQFALIYSLIYYAVYLGLFVLIIIGIINAANEQEKTVPLVGNLFVDKFDFIK
jgi:uncharacterized membrane protein